MVGNKGYRKYLKREVEQTIFSIDEEKLKAEERFDGKCVLVTNTTYSAEQVAFQYKQLWKELLSRLEANGKSFEAVATRY